MSNKPNQLVSSLFDALLGGYVAIVMWRVILPTTMAFQLPSFGALDVVLIVAGALVFFSLSAFTQASVVHLFRTGALPKQQRSRYITQHLGWLCLTVSVVGGWIITEISPLEFFSVEGLNGAGRIFKALGTPNFDIVSEALQAMLVTIYTAFMATMVAVPISFVLSFPAAKNVMNRSATERTIYSFLRAFLNIARSLEPIIWAIIFSVWVGIGPFAGMLALVVHTIASLTKQYSEQIESISDGPVEAIEATGASRLQVLWFAVVPQCILPFLSFTIYRWDINVRMATIIGFVGGGGIGTLLTQYQGLSKFNEVGTLVIIITLVVWMLDAASARVREVLK